MSTKCTLIQRNEIRNADDVQSRIEVAHSVEGGLSKIFLQFQQRNYSNNRTQIARNSRNMATTYLGRYQGERWEAE